MLDWYPLSFDSEGNLVRPEEIDGPDGIAAALFAPPATPVTDLWILSYGWNVDVKAGDEFYRTWVDLLRSAIQQANPANYNPMFVGVYWPSVILADTSSQPNPSPTPQPAPPLLDEREDFLPTLLPTLDERADFLPTLHPALDDRTAFIQAHRPIFDPEEKQDDAVFAQDFGGIYDFIAAADITDQQRVSAFIATLKKYQQQDPHGDQPNPQNVLDTAASGLAELLTTTLNRLFPAAVSDGLLEFLRVFSFWTMKARAGTVGVSGLAPVLASIRQNTAPMTPAPHIHLMGHSFGAKLLTASVYGAATHPEVGRPVIDTLILFQGAFSHYAFTRNIPYHPGLSGFYVNVIEQGLVSTPVAIMYSIKDLANYTLYPIGMAPVLDPYVPANPPDDPTQYQISDDFRGAIGAHGIQGFDDAQMSLVTLPWTGIDKNTLSTVRCINVNRTPFIDTNPNDPLTGLIGAHNDYTEPQIFSAAVGISLLSRGG